jgi:hypothetical protein
MRGTSRAQWLAFGSIALVGCVGSVAETPTDDAGGGVQHDAANATTHDSGSLQATGPEAGGISEAGLAQETGGGTEAGSLAEAGPVPDDAGVACQTRTGYFDCAGNLCDRSIQACYQNQCVWYGLLSSYEVPDAATCGPCPTCACLQGSLEGSCHCNNDPDGGLIISCGGCYGSPPARLERLV